MGKVIVNFIRLPNTKYFLEQKNKQPLATWIN